MIAHINFYLTLLFKNGAYGKFINSLGVLRQHKSQFRNLDDLLSARHMDPARVQMHKGVLRGRHRNIPARNVPVDSHWVLGDESASSHGRWEDHHRILVSLADKHWSGNVIFFTKFSSLTAPEILTLILQWRHNEHDGVSNHQRLYCLINRLFRHR